MVEDFLTNLKQEFSSRNDKTMKVAELKKVEQRSKTIKKLVKEFRRATRESGYEKKLLIKELK